jgi:hypothetical protein
MSDEDKVVLGGGGGMHPLGWNPNGPEPIYYIVVEQYVGLTERLNRVQPYGPFQSDEEAKEFVSSFSWSRATRGLTVEVLAKPYQESELNVR